MLNMVIYYRIFVIIFRLFICSEENVYLLCKKLCNDGIANADGSDLFVAFISNEKKQACTISSS